MKSFRTFQGAAVLPLVVLTSILNLAGNNAWSQQPGAGISGQYIQPNSPYGTAYNTGNQPQGGGVQSDAYYANQQTLQQQAQQQQSNQMTLEQAQAAVNAAAANNNAGNGQGGGVTAADLTQVGTMVQGFMTKKNNKTVDEDDAVLDEYDNDGSSSQSQNSNANTNSVPSSLTSFANEKHQISMPEYKPKWGVKVGAGNTTDTTGTGTGTTETAPDSSTTAPSSGVGINKSAFSKNYKFNGVGQPSGTTDLSAGSPTSQTGVKKNGYSNFKYGSGYQVGSILKGGTSTGETTSQTAPTVAPTTTKAGSTFESTSVGKSARSKQTTTNHVTTYDTNGKPITQVNDTEQYVKATGKANGGTIANRYRETQTTRDDGSVKRVSEIESVKMRGGGKPDSDLFASGDGDARRGKMKSDTFEIGTNNGRQVNKANGTVERYTETDEKGNEVTRFRMASITKDKTKTWDENGKKTVTQHRVSKDGTVYEKTTGSKGWTKLSGTELIERDKAAKAKNPNDNQYGALKATSVDRYVASSGKATLKKADQKKAAEDKSEKQRKAAEAKLQKQKDAADLKQKRQDAAAQKKKDQIAAAAKLEKQKKAAADKLEKQKKAAADKLAKQKKAAADKARREKLAAEAKARRDAQLRARRSTSSFK